MNVGDRVKWLPTGQEGRIFEVRGDIVAVRGEDWAVYDYADRFELVNECRVKPATSWTARSIQRFTRPREAVERAALRKAREALSDEW